MESMQTFYRAAGSHKDYWPQVEAFYDRTWGAFQMSMHTHTWCEVMYVFSGSCDVIYGEDVALHMRAGDFVFLDAGVAHRLHTREDAPCTMLNVEFSLVASGAEGFSLRALRAQSADVAGMLTGYAPVFRGNDLGGQLFRAMDLLLQSLSTGREESPALHRAEMMLFLLRLAQAVQANRQPRGTVRHVRRAVAYIQHHFGETVTVPGVAESVGVHADYLSHLFKGETGETVMGYLARVRNDHAATLLLRSALPLEGIAQEVGYASRQQLTRSFKRQFGVAPLAYRKKHG